MAGVTLSRWTMSYFALALVSLLAAELLMAAGFGFPAAPITAPETLILVHLTAIGWLSLLMCGALFQFVPVLVTKPLHSNTLPLPTLICLAAGLAALLCGFLQLAGIGHGSINLLPIGGSLLGLGFTLALWNLGRTLWSARPLPLPARFVLVGLVSLTVTATLGIIFTLVLSDTATQRPFPELTAAGIPLHAIAGLGGWLSFTAMGVSYRLLAMFMLAPELDAATSRGAFYLGTASLITAVIGGVTAISLDAPLGAILLVAALLGLGTLILYGSDIVQLYRLRKRRVIELNSRMASIALVNLATAVILTVILIATNTLERHVGALAFLIAFGWLSGLALAKLFKIVAFLTWLECYGPILGKAPTPRVQDLVVEPRASKWYVLYFGAVWLSTLCLLVGASAGFRAGAALMALATLGACSQFLRTRRLADVASALRLPAGAQKPRLLVSTIRHA